MNNSHASRLPGQLEALSSGAAVAVVAIGTLGLIGWSLNIPVLTSLDAGLISMKVNTALAFVLAGGALWLLQEKRVHLRAGRAAARGAAVLVAMLGFLTLLEYVFGWNLGLDELLVREHAGAVLTVLPGRMAPNTALNFLLIGVSLLLLDVQTRGGHHPARYCIGLGATIAAAALVGYIYGAPRLYAPVAAWNGMSLPAVLAGNFAFFGLGLARPGSDWLELLAGNNPGSLMARRFLLPVLLVPIALDVLLMMGQHLGFYDDHVESAGHVVLTVAVFLALVLVAARSLNLSDAERRRAEAETARLAAIVESSNDAILSKDLEGSIQSWNPAAERMFGYRAEEILGQPIGRILPPDRKEEEERFLQRLARGERIEHYETQRVAKDGRRLDVSVTVSPLKDLAGRVIGASKIVRDITRRKQAEEQLRLLAAALQSAANAIAITNRDGLLQWINAAFTRLTGYTADEALGQNPRVLKSGQHEPPFYREMWETILAGRVWHGELVNKRKDGSLYREEMTITPVRDSDGAITHFIAVKQDITERKAAEAALQAARDQLEARVLERTMELKKAHETVDAERKLFEDVLNQLPAYLVLLSPDYHVPFANRYFEERFGKSEGRRCYEYLFNRAEPCEDCETFRVLKTGDPHHWEWTGPDGRIYDVHDFPFTDTDGSRLIMEVGLDITERKQAETALKQLNETLERRVADRTAELRDLNAELARFNRAMIGRELRMIELKNEVNDLCRRAAEPLRYPDDSEHNPKPASN